VTDGRTNFGDYIINVFKDYLGFCRWLITFRKNIVFILYREDYNVNLQYIENLKSRINLLL
jgi:hypothetical protein